MDYTCGIMPHYRQRSRLMEETSGKGLKNWLIYTLSVRRTRGMSITVERKILLIRYSLPARLTTLSHPTSLSLHKSQARYCHLEHIICKECNFSEAQQNKIRKSNKLPSFEKGCTTGCKLTHSPLFCCFRCLRMCWKAVRYT